MRSSNNSRLNSKLEQVIHICTLFNFPEPFLKEIKSISYRLQRIPILKLMDLFIQSRDNQIRSFADNHPFIYYNQIHRSLSSKYNLEHAKAFNRFIYHVNKFTSSLRRTIGNQTRDYSRFPLDIINNEESTAFFPGFLRWTLYKFCTNVHYIGTRKINTTKPSWCYSAFSMEICFQTSEDALLGFDRLYDTICDSMSQHRSIETRICLKEIFFYGTMANNNANIIDRDKVLSRSILKECNRLINEIGYGILMDGESLIIPIGEPERFFIKIRDF